MSFLASSAIGSLTGRRVYSRRWPPNCRGAQGAEPYRRNARWNRWSARWETKRSQPALMESDSSGYGDGQMSQRQRGFNPASDLARPKAALRGWCIIQQGSSPTRSLPQPCSNRRQGAETPAAAHQGSSRVECAFSGMRSANRARVRETARTPC